MKRKFLEALGQEKKAIDKLMAENGNDMNTVKADYIRRALGDAE